MTHRVSVVGAGIGADHCAGYAALPDRFSIHSVCDLDEARGRHLAGQFGAEYQADFAQVLSNPDVDIVDICLPPHLHFSACMEALEAGKVVVCEKPLVGSLREADALKVKVAETDGVLSPVFQYRYGLGMSQLRALIDAGLAGTCFAGTLETHWDRPASYYQNDWRGAWAGELGGAVLGHAIHLHDLLSSLLGPVSRVFAETATRVNDIEVEDCAALAIRMEGGAVITSSMTLGAADNTTRLRLMFEGFTVESDHTAYSPASAPWTFTARLPTRQKDIDRVLSGIGQVPSGYAGMFAALADALEGNGGREVTLTDARMSLEFVSAVYASARLGAPVNLPLAADHPFYDGWLL